MLVAAGGDGGEQDVVAELFGGRVDGLDEFGVEGLFEVHHDAEGAAAAAGEHLRGAVGAVAEFLGGFEDAFAGCGARAGAVAEHQGDECAGDAGSRGHVGHGRALAPVVPLLLARKLLRPKVVVQRPSFSCRFC